MGEIELCRILLEEAAAKYQEIVARYKQREQSPGLYWHLAEKA